MEHNDIRHKLSEYIDGSVSAKEKADIEEHLKTCQQCSDALNELRKTIEHIKSVEEVEPPPWMTRKIMATVRAEAERKSLFQRLFYPLAIKLPIQAVAVVFLAVTAFSIYRSIQPAQTPSEARIQEFAAQQEAPQKGARAKDHTIVRKPPDRLRKVPQSPGYKALDMKMEYEKPAPAKPAEQPMPGKKEAAVGERFAAPQDVAPTMMQDEAIGAAPQAETKLKSAAPARRALKALPTDKAGPVIIVRVKDIEAAAREVEQAITQLGGSITRTDNIEEKKVFVAKVNAQKLPDLKNKLKHIGKVTDESVAQQFQDGQVELKIELVPDSAKTR